MPHRPLSLHNVVPLGHYLYAKKTIWKTQNLNISSQLLVALLQGMHTVQSVNKNYAQIVVIYVGFSTEED